MPLSIKNKFGIGEVVYLVNDQEQLERFVVYIIVHSNGLTYGVRYSDGEVTEHYDYEIVSEKTVKL